MAETIPVRARSLPELLMVFDVESIGLHGDGFAVATAKRALDKLPWPKRLDTAP